MNCKNKRCNIPIDSDELQALLRVKRAKLETMEAKINLPLNEWEEREKEACEIMEQIQALEKGYCGVNCWIAAEEKDP